MSAGFAVWLFGALTVLTICFWREVLGKDAPEYLGTRILVALLASASWPIVVGFGLALLVADVIERLRAKRKP